MAVNAHRDAVHQTTVQSIKAEAAKLKADAQAKLAAHKQAEANDAKLTANQKGCQNGLAAYNLLSTAQIQKNHIVKPVCPVQ